MSRDAHQLCSQVINLNPISTFAIGYLVQSMAILFKDAVFETHTLTSGTNAPRDQALKNRSSGVQKLQIMEAPGVNKTSGWLSR